MTTGGYHYWTKRQRADHTTYFNSNPKTSLLTRSTTNTLQGVILEASPLPTLPIHSLGRVTHQPTPSIPLHAAPQSGPDTPTNALPTTLTPPAALRTPIILLADSILDPGNVGALARSAYMLGAAGLALCTRTCGPVSAAAVKASAGAAEALPVLAVERAAAFLDASVANGWVVVAAVAEGLSGTGEPGLVWRRRGGGKEVRVCGVEEVLGRPIILAVGGEGEGLRESIRRRAEYFVRINPVRSANEVGVDSLNVSVAAALICQHLVSASLAAAKTGENKNAVKELW